MEKRIWGRWRRWLSCMALAPFGVMSQEAWRTEIKFPDDPFFYASPYGDYGQTSWVKCLVMRDEPTTVVFQDSNRWPFHYDFAVSELDAFAGMSPEAFDAVTLHETGRLAWLGAVVKPPYSMSPICEVGIQLVGREPIPKETVRDLVRTIAGAIRSGEDFDVFYFPTYEQAPVAQMYEAWFESQGIPISSPARWIEGNHLYAEGWALGELKYFPGDLIESAFVNGLLKPDDILLTDGVPAEIPMVAGVMSLSPSTPNSHVAILSQTAGAPFVWLAKDEDVARALELVGRRVFMSAYEVGLVEIEPVRFRLVDAENMDETIAEEILDLKQPPALNMAPMAEYGAFYAATEDLNPSDIRFFGGKAANFGILRRTLPDHSPRALAFSFDLWKAFMAQEFAAGKTLGEAIRERLAPFDWPPVDMAAVNEALSWAKTLIRDDQQTTFSAALRASVLTALADERFALDPMRNIRFRSSTNMEDGPVFNGAGLYDSYSGCLADDQDAGVAGPSVCDPTEVDERGVFRAIRRVFASFYNPNAFLERLRYGVDEGDVGMAILVHHSFPDVIEEANGVAVLSRRGTYYDIEIVSQTGAWSVANPDGSSQAEVVHVRHSDGSSYYASIETFSNRLVLGETVLIFPDDYEALARMMKDCAQAYGAAVGKGDLLLDYEFKQTAPDGALVIKQIREVPDPNAQPPATRYLINDPARYDLWQTEYGDIFSLHRLKSRWLFETRDMRLDADSLTSGLLAGGWGEMQVDGRRVAWRGAIDDWPGMTYRMDGLAPVYRLTPGNARRGMILELHFGDLLASADYQDCPVLTLRDLSYWRITIAARHDRPVPVWEWGDGQFRLAETWKDWATLRPAFTPHPGDTLQERQIEDGSGLRVETQFYWPPAPLVSAGYTAPLSRWVASRIEGLTSETLVLTDPYAQTYGPGHHNFSEFFLYEPALDSGLSPAARAALESRNIQYLLVTDTFGASMMLPIAGAPATPKKMQNRSWIFY